MKGKERGEGWRGFRGGRGQTVDEGLGGKLRVEGLDGFLDYEILCLFLNK